MWGNIDAAAPELTPANPKGTEGWTQVTAVRGFDSPESVWYDSTLDIYFVSNTGSGNGDDSRGFISRLKSDGTIDSAVATVSITVKAANDVFSPVDGEVIEDVPVVGAGADLASAHAARPLVDGHLFPQP